MTACVGVGAVVLGVVGEVLWHVNTGATASGSHRVVRVTGASAMAEATASSMAFGGIRSKTRAFTSGPIFKPFVYVDLPIPENYTLVPGPGVHLNNDGVTIATMNDGSHNYGFIWYDEDYTDSWQGPIEDGSGDIILDAAGLTGINDELELCGTRVNSGSKAFFLALSTAYTGSLTQIGSGYSHDLNNLGVVVGTSTGGSPVGWWNVAGAPVALPALPSGDGTNAAGVTPNTNLSGSLIVGQSKDINSKYQAVVWHNDSGWLVDALTSVTGSNVGFAIDVNDDDVIVGGILTSGTISDTIEWYYDDVNSVWAGVSLDVDPVFIPEAINDAANPEIVGGQYLWASTDIAAGLGTQMDLMDMSLGIPSNMINMRCTDINNNGVIVGVGQLGSGGDWVAFKLVPYDMDNNESPDFREIIANPGLDDDEITGGNWVLDVAEMMRVGLHAPATDSISRQITNAQVIRKMRDINNVYEAMVGDETGETCEDEANDATAWGNNTFGGGDFSDQGKEIVVNIRSKSPENDDNRDYIVKEGDDHTVAEYKQALECFAHRYARCIDYVQIGNEVWDGNGVYSIRTGQLENAPSYHGDMNATPATYFDDALDLMFDQLQ